MTAVDEAARHEAVQRYRILDTPPDGAFDRIVRLASRLLDVPIAIVSIEGKHGVDVAEIPRSPRCCARATRCSSSPTG